MTCICGKEYDTLEAIGIHASNVHFKLVQQTPKPGQTNHLIMSCWCGLWFHRSPAEMLRLGHHLTASGSEDVAAHYLECQLKGE